MRKLYKKKENSPVRKKEIDIAKGIGIIAVVYGHTFTSLGLYIYIFHLPLFFVISGFLYASKDKEPLMPYVKNKIHSLLIPYFIFLVLTNALLFGLYAVTGQEFYLYPSMLYHPYGASTALWFLPALLWVTVIYKLIDIYVPYKLKALTVILMFVIGRILSHHDITTPTFIDTALTSTIFYLAGIIMCRYKSFFNLEIVLYMLIISLLPCVMINAPVKIDLMKNEYEPFYFMFLSVLISFLIIRISYKKSVAKSRIGTCLAYLGKISLIILAFHLFTFELFYLIVPKETILGMTWILREVTTMGITIFSIALIVGMNKLLRLDLLIDWISGSHRLTQTINRMKLAHKKI